MKRRSRVETYAEVKRLSDEGRTNKYICITLGLSASSLRNIINDPEGSKQKARRERYRGTCQECGRKTDGSSGYNAPKLCVHCSGEKHKIWTREKIVTAIQEWAKEHGRPPRASDWVRSGPNHPSTGAVHKRPSGSFIYWADAIEAAGFPRPRTGHYERKNKWTKEEIIEVIQSWAAEHGRPPSIIDWSPSTEGRPHPHTVARRFGSWSSGIVAAGFEKPIVGRKRVVRHGR